MGRHHIGELSVKGECSWRDIQFSFKYSFTASLGEARRCCTSQLWTWQASLLWLLSTLADLTSHHLRFLNNHRGALVERVFPEATPSAHLPSSYDRHSKESRPKQKTPSQLAINPQSSNPNRADAGRDQPRRSISAPNHPPAPPGAAPTAGDAAGRTLTACKRTSRSSYLSSPKTVVRPTCSKSLDTADTASRCWFHTPAPEAGGGPAPRCPDESSHPRLPLEDNFSCRNPVASSIKPRDSGPAPPKIDGCPSQGRRYSRCCARRRLICAVHL